MRCHFDARKPSGSLNPWFRFIDFCQSLTHTAEIQLKPSRFACPVDVTLQYEMTITLGHTMQTQPDTVKQAATSLLQSLPDDVTWESLQYHLFVRQQIELALADADAGRLLDTSEVRKRLDAAKSGVSA